MALVKLGLWALVVDLILGYLGSHRFLHVHALSDSHAGDRVRLGTISREAACLFIAKSPNLPVVIGDLIFFKEALDTMSNHKSKVCRPIADFLSIFPLVDCFRHFPMGAERCPGGVHMSSTVVRT